MWPSQNLLLNFNANRMPELLYFIVCRVSSVYACAHAVVAALYAFLRVRWFGMLSQVYFKHDFILKFYNIKFYFNLLVVYVIVTSCP
jgi:hypothetical protein